MVNVALLITVIDTRKQFLIFYRRFGRSKFLSKAGCEILTVLNCRKQYSQAEEQRYRSNALQRKKQPG